MPIIQVFCRDCAKYMGPKEAEGIEGEELSICPECMIIEFNKPDGPGEDRLG